VEFANFGESVAGAGDVNGDGYADVIVGDPNYGNGAAFVFLGGPSGVANGNPATAATRITADPADMPACPTGGNAGFGARVASAGDIDGDGFDDVIIGAPLYSALESGEGAAFVFLGSALGIASGTAATAAAQLESNQAGASFGTSVASADLDHDG